ncbi:MAG: hypothetical protein JWQ49_2600 [Edaphobacter sp.]|nr:hypothetical protein [Edaphobacter sp.]
MVGSGTREIVATSTVAVLAMLVFGLPREVGGDGRPKGLPTKSALDSKSHNNAAIQTKPVLEVRDVPGVDCTGATDSADALNALTGHFPRTDNTISGRTLAFDGCPSIKLSNTWLIKNHAGFIIDGFTRSGAASKGILITWDGPASGVMIDMEYVDGFIVRGLNIQGAAKGGVGIQVDKNGAGGIWNTTDGIFANNTYQGASRNWIGISISPVSGDNVEDMRVEDSAFYCNAPASTTAGVGVMIGDSANAKNEIIKHIYVTNCWYGVWKKNGSFQVRESEFTGNGGTCGSGGGADIRDDVNSDVDIIDGNLDENSTQGLNEGDDRGGGYSHPVIVRGNHAAPAGCANLAKYWYNTAAGTIWIFEGDSWDADPRLLKVIGTSHNGSGTIYTRGLIYPNSKFIPWWTNNSTAIADDLKIMDDKLMVYAAKSSAIPSVGNNYPSPYLVLRGYLNGSTSTPDDFALQDIPASGGSTGGGTFLIKHQQGATGTEMFGWDGSYPGINIDMIPTPSAPAVGNVGSNGTSRYVYAVVAFGPSGNTAGSSTSTTSTGAATLSSTNYNQLQWYPVAGATKYCVWRTASSGSPSSTGNIGCISSLQVKNQGSAVVSFNYTTNMGGVTNPYRFNDIGLAADSSSLPRSNTTGALSLPGQITSTLPTGIAPLSIASSTPVSNLTLTAHPQVYDAGVFTTAEKIYVNSQALNEGAAVHTFATGFRFISSRTFGCICTDQTAANACRAVPASATEVTLAGTGSDILWLQCTGH